MASRISITNIELYHVDVVTGVIERLTRDGVPVAFAQDLKCTPDGRLWVASDDGSDFKRLGVFNTDDGTFDPSIEES